MKIPSSLYVSAYVFIHDFGCFEVIFLLVLKLLHFPILSIAKLFLILAIIILISFVLKSAHTQNEILDSEKKDLYYCCTFVSSSPLFLLLIRSISRS